MIYLKCLPCASIVLGQEGVQTRNDFRRTSFGCRLRPHKHISLVSEAVVHAKVVSPQLPRVNMSWCVRFGVGRFCWKSKVSMSTASLLLGWSWPPTSRLFPSQLLFAALLSAFILSYPPSAFLWCSLFWRLRLHLSSSGKEINANAINFMLFCFSSKRRT